MDYVVDNAAMGRAKVWFYEQEETKRENPCDSCKFAERCDANGTDCFAFRRWTYNGDYNDKQIDRLTRPFDVV
jgi:hypothetical protein